MHLFAPNQHWFLDEFEFLRIARRRGESSCSLGGRNATLMSRCFLGCDQLAAGVTVAGTTGNPRTLFPSHLSERQKSCESRFRQISFAVSF